MSAPPGVDPVALRENAESKYREVALHPAGDHHLLTGGPLTARLDCEATLVDPLPAPSDQECSILLLPHLYR